MNFISNSSNLIPSPVKISAIPCREASVKSFVNAGNSFNLKLYNFSVDRTTDYLYDNYLFGRSESSGFFSQQYVRYEGAFKSDISEFKPNDLMISLNTGITIWKWIEAYFDYGLFKNKNEPILTGFDSGFRLNIVENYFELFFPIYSSEDFYINKKSYSNRIRFILTLDPENLTSLFTRRWF